MQTDGWEIQRQSSSQLYPSLDGLDHLRHRGMAWVEGRVSVDDTNDGPGQGIVAVAEGFDEDFAKEE